MAGCGGEGITHMLVGQILKSKGTEVATIAPDATIADVIAALAEFHVGALVVSSDKSKIDGIISERDVVRGLAHHGGVSEMAVAELMTAEVVTCTLESTTEQLMSQMTEHRFRHVPVVDDDKLIGIVSIGDVVNARVRELETEREQLTDYISGR